MSIASRRRFLASLTLVLVVFVALPGRAAAAAPGDLALDLLVLRPLGLARIAVGAPFFLVSAPFMAIQGKVAESWEFFVDEPVKNTFRRDLGDF